jgi:hypothetical protein
MLTSRIRCAINTASVTLPSEQVPFPRVAFYDAAVLEDAPRFVRGMIVHGIKSAVLPERFDRFLVIYNHEKELKQAAAFLNPDGAYVLRLDAAGNVVWRAHGEVTAADSRI